MSPSLALLSGMVTGRLPSACKMMVPVLDSDDGRTSQTLFMTA